MPAGLGRVSPATPGRVLGIDAGGTKTHIAVGRRTAAAHDPADEDALEFEVEHVLATSRWRSGDRNRDGAALAATVTEVLGAEVLGLPAVVGAHGCDSTAQCEELQRSLGRAGMGDARVVNDAELMPATVGVTDGIGVVCGTGSIAVARDDHGRLVTAGGWGWVLGDEGSAAGLVRDAVRAVLAGIDEGEPADPLRLRLFAAFGVDDGPELAMAVTRRSDAAWWGSHAATVFAAADEGSARAAAVIVAGGRALALLVARLVRRLSGVEPTATTAQPGAGAARVVVAGGSVVLGQERLRSAFVQALNQTSPLVTPQFLSRPPVVGALYLAASTPARPLVSIPVPEVPL